MVKVAVSTMESQTDRYVSTLRRFVEARGDEWHFTLHTESINAGPALHQPRVLEQHGTAPKQYGGW